MRVILTCGGGFSTAVLAKELIKVAKNDGYDIEVIAIGYLVLEHELNNDDKFDMILVAPQIRHKFSELSDLADSKNIAIDQIGFDEYAPIGAPKLYKRCLKNILGDKHE